MPCSARARSSTTAFGASANASVETVSSAEPASAMRRPPTRGVTRPGEQPDHRRRQRIGGQHEARARLGEMEAVGVARQQRHDRLVERRLDEHRQADRDRDAARVHDSILPARAAAGGGAPAVPDKALRCGRNSFDHSPTRGTRRQFAYHDPPIRRPGATQTAPQRERPERNPPATCLRAPPRHDCTGSTALRRPARGERHARGSARPCGIRSSGTRSSSSRSSGR